MSKAKKGSHPPYFGRVAYFSDYTQDRWGKFYFLPRTVKQYVDYKYWCITHGFDAIAGEVQPEERAFQAYCDTVESGQAEFDREMSQIIDNYWDL